jgi:hypothetical protein
MTFLTLALMRVAGGCVPVVELDDTGDSESGTTATGSTSTTSGATVGSSATLATTSDATATTTTSTDTSGSSSWDDEGPSFIMRPDGGGCFLHRTHCSTWHQDCPVGEKCMPWANDGGNAWNATKCTPVDANPGQPGEPCTVEGSGVSGIDSCDVGAMCFFVDGATNMGECVAMCEGSAADPQCAGGCDQCLLANDGVLALCLPACDPLVQDCGDGRGCYPNSSAGFVCLPSVASGEVSGACEVVNGCTPGEVCVAMELVPDCVEQDGCCAPLCDLAAPDPCPGAAPGVECVAWFDLAPEVCVDWSTLGACVLP